MRGCLLLSGFAQLNWAVTRVTELGDPIPAAASSQLASRIIRISISPLAPFTRPCFSLHLSSQAAEKAGVTDAAVQALNEQQAAYEKAVKASA